MKRLLFLMLISGIISCSDEDELTIDCLPSNLQNGVVAFYPFNDGSLMDGSGNSNDLTNSTAAYPSVDRMGNNKCAFEFNNSQSADEYLTTSKSQFIDGLSEFSISLWYQPMNSAILGQTIHGLFSRGTETSCPNRMGDWSLGLYDCRRAVFAHNNSVWANSVTNYVDGCQGEVDALVDKWHHIVGVKNGDDYKVYFNGVLDETSTGNAQCNNLQLVQDLGDVYVGYNFTGKIDDIILYNRELTPVEITELHVLKPCCE